MDLQFLQSLAENMTLILNVTVLGYVLFGALVGLIRGFWKASFRFVLYGVLVVGGIIALPLIIDWLLDFNVGSFVPSLGGITFTTLRELPQSVLNVYGPVEIVLSPAMVELILELTTALLSLVLFIVYFVLVGILVYPLHWILFPLTVGLFFRRKFRKRHKLRLFGAVFGAGQAALTVSVLMLPLAGLDTTVRKMDNLDDVAFGSLLREIGSAYGNTVLATILKAIQSTSMPNGLDIAAIDHLLGMTLGETQTSLRHELETILLIANELFATGFISTDVELANFIYDTASGSLLAAISGVQNMAMPTVDANLLLANMTPEIAQAIFAILSDSSIVTTLIPAAIESAASLDIISAYASEEMIADLLDGIDWQHELLTLGEIAAVAIEMDLQNLATTPLDPSTLDADKVQQLALLVADSQLIASALPIAMTSLTSQFVPEPYYTDLSISEIDFSSYDWSDELTNIASLSSTALSIYQTVDPTQVSINTFAPEDVTSILDGIAQSDFIMDLFPTLVEYGIEVAKEQAQITDLTIDLSSIVWADELTMFADVYEQIYAVGGDPLTINWSTAETEKITAINGAIAALFSSNLLVTVLPVLFEYGLTYIPAEYQSWVDLSLLNLDGLTGEDWSTELQTVFEIYRSFLNDDGTMMTGVLEIVGDTELIDQLAAYLGNSILITPMLSHVLEQAVASVNFTEVLGFDFDASSLGFDSVDWSLELPLIAEIAQYALSIDFTSITAADLDFLLNKMLDSQVFYPAFPELVAGLASSFNLTTALPGVDLSLPTLQAISDANGWQAEIALLVHVFEIVDQNFGGIAGIATYDFASFLSDPSAPAIIEDMANTMLDSALFAEAFKTLILDALETAAITVDVDTSIWTTAEWKNEISVIADLLSVFSTYDLDIANLGDIMNNPDIDGIIRDGLVPAFDSQILFSLLTSTMSDAITGAGYSLPADIDSWTSTDWKDEMTIVADIMGGLNDQGVALADIANILDNPNIGTIISDVLSDAIPSRLFGPIIKDTITDAISSAGLAIPGDIDTWSDAVWVEELNAIGSLFTDFQTYDLDFNSFATITTHPDVGDIIRDILVDAVETRLVGPIIKDTIQDAVTGAGLTLPADIATWSDVTWGEELTYIADVFDGINSYGLTLETLSNITSVTNAGDLIIAVIVPAIDSQLLGDNIIDTLTTSLTGSGLTMPAVISAWEKNDWKTEITTIGQVLNAAEDNDLDISNFTTLMDRDDVGDILRNVVTLMFDSVILGDNAKDTLKSAFTASPSVTLPADIDLWTTLEWKTEITNIADVMDTLALYDVTTENIGTIMDLPNASVAVEDILLSMMDSRMLKGSVKQVLSDTVASTGFASPDTTTWTDLQWKTEVSEIADILAVSETEGLNLDALSNVVLSQASAPALGRLMNEVADSMLLIDGLNSTLNGLFNTPSIGDKLAQPIAVNAAVVDWEDELTLLSYITDNIDNLGNTADVAWSSNTSTTLVSLRRSAVLGLHTEVLLADGFSSLGVDDFINTSSSDGIVYWIDVAIIREDAVLPDPEPSSFSLSNALDILKETKDSIAGAIPTGGGQAELLLGKINSLHKDYGWIQDGKLTDIVDRGLEQAGIGDFLGADAALLRPEMVETDPDELPLLGRLLDTMGSQDLADVTFTVASVPFIDNVMKDIESLEMFKSGTVGVDGANVALIEKLFDASPDVQEIIYAHGIIDLAHRENVAPVGDADQTVLLDALNSMVDLKDILTDTNALSDSQVLKDIRDLETVYQIVVGDNPSTPAADGTLANKVRDVMSSGYFSTYSSDMDYSKIYLDSEIDLLINDILGVKDTLVIDANVLSTSKPTLIGLFENISDSLFLGNAREDILNDMIDDASGRSGSDLVNAELATFDWTTEINALDDGLAILPAVGGSLTTLSGTAINDLFETAAPTRILSRIFVDELNGLSSELSTSPTPSFVWTTAKLDPIHARTLNELISMDGFGAITPSNYSALASKIGIYDRLITVGDGLVDETVGDDYYRKDLAANYLPAFISKATSLAYTNVSHFSSTTNFTRVADQFDDILVGAMAVNTTYGDPTAHLVAINSLEGLLDVAVDAEIAELSIRIQGVIALNTNDYNSFTTNYPLFAEMFELDTNLD